MLFNRYNKNSEQISGISTEPSQNKKNNSKKVNDKIINPRPKPPLQITTTQPNTNSKNYTNNSTAPNQNSSKSNKNYPHTPYDKVSSSQTDYRANYDIQSQKILDLTSYKNLCEKFIKKLLPNQTFPLTAQDLEYLDSCQLNQNSSSRVMELELEKKQLTDLLNKQNVVNDQQRNYIEILKETIESNLIKNGLSNFITNSGLNTTMTRPNQSQNQSFSYQNLNELIDVSKLVTETEETKKELDKSNMIIKEISNNLKESKKANEDLTAMINTLKSKLDGEKENNDILNKKINQNINTIEDKNKVLDDLQKQNVELKNSLNEYQTLVQKYETNIFEGENKINDLKKQLSFYEHLQENFDENKGILLRLENTNSQLQQEKENLGIQIKKLKEDNKELIAKRNELSTLIENKEQSFQKEKKDLLEEKKDISRNLTKKENAIGDMKNTVHEKEQEIIRYKEKEILHEKAQHNLKVEYENLSKEFDDYKAKAESKLEIINKSNKNLTENLNQAKVLLQGKDEECQLLNSKNAELKSEFSKLFNEHNELINKNSEMEKTFGILQGKFDNQVNDIQSKSEELIKISNDKSSLSQELMYWKEKYEKEIEEKANEINQLKNTANVLSEQIDSLENKNQKLANEKELIASQIYSLNEKNKELHDNLNSSKQTNYELNQDLQDKRKSIKAQQLNSSELSNKIAIGQNRIKDLEDRVGTLLVEKKGNEDIIQRLQKELYQLNESLCSKKENINVLSNNFEAQNYLIQQCIDAITQFVSKILSQENCYYSNYFIEFIKSLERGDNQMEKLKIIRSFLGEVCVEFNRWDALLRDIEIKNNNITEKNLTLQANVNEFANSVQRANEYIENNEERLRKIVQENAGLKSFVKELQDTIGKIKNEHGEMYYECQNYKKENASLKENINQLMYENETKEKIINNANNKIDSLEYRVNMLNKANEIPTSYY